MIAHCYNEIINHYDISTQEKLGGGKLRPHKNKNKIRKQPRRRCVGWWDKNEFRDVLPELVRRKRARTYLSQPLHS